MILARKIVTLNKARLDGHSVAFGIPYRCYVGTHNENHDFIEQKRVFDSLGEDLGVTSGIGGGWALLPGAGEHQGRQTKRATGQT